jgi:hypothetical protein
MMIRMEGAVTALGWGLAAAPGDSDSSARPGKVVAPMAA